MGKKDIDIEIRPGTMFSDVVETDLGTRQHKEVVNIRQEKVGEWECVKGYINGKTGFTGLKNGIEVTEDRTGERFLLLQDGTDLKRIDYDISASPLTGYENESVTTISLPSGVTISASAKLRFFYFRGVVRISGSSSPMWYGYIKRDLFDDSGSGIAIDGWILRKAELEDPIPAIEAFHAELYGVFGSTVYNVTLVRVFLIYDDSQYSLMSDVAKSDPYNITYNELFGVDYELISYEGPTGMARIGLRFPGAALLTAYTNKRVTGLGVAAAVIDYNTQRSFDPETEPFYIVEILPINEDLSKIRYSREHFFYDATYKDRLYLNNGGLDYLVKEDAYLAVGLEIEIKTIVGTLSTSIIGYSNSAPFNYGVIYIQLADNVYPTLKSVDTDGELTLSGVTITRKWIYDASDGYETYFPILGSDLIQNFFSFTDIPSGTKDINPDYTHHVIIEERPFIKSEEDEEEDVVRYGSLLQFDSFPNGNIIQTQVGDIDRNKAIVKRSDRLMILKATSISQISFVGTNYKEDLGLKARGVLGADFFYVVGSVLYYGDKEDVYIYAGAGDPVALLSGQLMRSYYRLYVDSNSLIFYRKLDNELWIILSGGNTMVYHFDRKEWYIRSTDIDPLFAFLDADNNMHVGASTKLVTFDHSQTTFGESINYSFRTMLFDLKTPQFHKKVKEFFLVAKSNKNIVVTIHDPREAASWSETITPSSSRVGDTDRERPGYIFKDADVYVTGVAANNLSATIRSAHLQVTKWK